MKVVSIWCSDDGDDEFAERRATRWREGDGKNWPDDAEVAAEWYAEISFYESDYPEKQTICVRTDDGKVHTFDVETEYTANFSAWEREP